MRQNCKNQIIQIIKSIKSLQHNKKCTQAMLIVDQTTVKLLNSVVQLFFSLGVKNITKISLKKKPQPDTIGIYYLSSSSIQLIKQDFKKEPSYYSINILLCEQATPQIMKEIALQAQIIERLAFFGILKLNTKYIDSNFGLICEQFNLLKGLIKNKGSLMSKDIGSHIYESLISSFGDNLLIKVFHQNQNANYMVEIINKMQSKHKDYHEHMSNGNASQSQQKKINLLLVDRKLDLVSPFIRNFYYLTIISDLFHLDYVHNDVKIQDKLIKLNLEDSIFKDYKNLYIGKAQTLIEGNFKKFVAQNKAAQLQKEKVIEKGSLKNIIRQIPQFNRKVVSYQQNIGIMGQLSAVIKESNLTQVGQIQQLIITGINKQGQQMKDKKIYQRALQFFNKSEVKSTEIAVKVYLLLLLCTQMSQSQRTALINKIQQFQQYKHISAFIQSHLKELAPKPIKLKLPSSKERSFLEMHESVVAAILNELIQKGSSKQVNLMVIGQQIKKNVSKFQAVSQRVSTEWVICMLGGISINQICHLQRIGVKSEGTIISILSDSILTTWNYGQRLIQAFS